MSKVQITLRDGLRAELRMRGHTLFADEPVKDGGSDAGPMPSELVVAALGACAAITVRLYAQRKGWPLESVEIEAETERFNAVDHPTYQGEGDVVNEFRQTMRFNGDLTAEQKARLLDIAGRCPVHRLFTQPNLMIERLAEETVEAALGEEN